MKATHHEHKKIMSQAVRVLIHPTRSRYPCFIIISIHSNGQGLRCANEVPKTDRKRRRERTLIANVFFSRCQENGFEQIKINETQRSPFL